ncbi:hypothetical protein FS842_005611, partial [Serendipita sp. 407]
MLSRMSAHSIVSCSQTCQRLYRIVAGSSHLQLILELAVEGLRLRRYPSRCMPCGMDTKSAAERLVQFRRWKEAWIRQKPSRRLTLDIPIKISVVKDGLYACLVFGRSPKDTIEIYSLWMEEGQRDLNLWKRHELDIRVDAFSLDPSENLLMLVQSCTDSVSENHDEYMLRVHLRTLNTALPHPNARMVILGQECIPFRHHYHISSWGDIIATLLQGYGSGMLFVWNWKTGEELYRCSNSYGYAYLSPSSIMVCVSKSSREALAGNFIELLDIHDSSHGLVTLQLPIIGSFPSVEVFSQAISGDSPNLCDDIPISPYIQDETAERLVIITSHSSSGLHFFLLVRPLLRLLAKRKQTSSSSEPKPNLLSWDEWKQGTAYSTDSEHLAVGCISIWGACAGFVYFRDLRSEDESLSTVEVPLVEDNERVEATGLFLDFNPRPVTRALSRAMPTECDDTLGPRRLAESLSRELFFNGILPDKLRCFTVNSEVDYLFMMSDGGHVVLSK